MGLTTEAAVAALPSASTEGGVRSRTPAGRSAGTLGTADVRRSVPEGTWRDESWSDAVGHRGRRPARDRHHLGVTGDPEQIEIRYAFTTDAADLLVPLIDEFNESGPTSDGRPVHVVPESREGISSGETQRRSPPAALEPVIWTPASSLWAGLLAANFGDPSAPGARSLAQSPQVVAMFNERHTELTSAAQSGSVDPRPGLQDVLEEATTDPAFNFAHTDPNQSTSGLSMVLSEFHLAGESNANTLTLADVADGKDEVAGYEQSVAHYVDIARDFSTLWCDNSDRSSPTPRTCRRPPTSRSSQSESPGPIHRALPGRCATRGRLPLRDPRGNLGQVGQPNERRAERSSANGSRNASTRTVGTSRSRGCGEATASPYVPPRSGPPAATTHARAARPGRDQEARHGAAARRDVMLVVDQSVEMLGGGRFETLLSALQGVGIDGQDAFVNCLQQNDSVGMIVFGTPEADGPSESVPLAREAPSRPSPPRGRDRRPRRRSRAGDDVRRDRRGVGEPADAQPRQRQHRDRAHGGHRPRQRRPPPRRRGRVLRVESAAGHRGRVRRPGFGAVAAPGEGVDRALLRRRSRRRGCVREFVCDFL